MISGLLRQLLLPSFQSCSTILAATPILPQQLHNSRNPNPTLGSDLETYGTPTFSEVLFASRSNRNSSSLTRSFKLCRNSSPLSLFSFALTKDVGLNSSSRLGVRTRQSKDNRAMEALTKKELTVAVGFVIFTVVISGVGAWTGEIHGRV
ncbi:hypothetical protein TB1_000910 [Malus domestica]